MGNNHVSDESGAGRLFSRRVVLGAAVAGTVATAGLLLPNIATSPSPPSVERRAGSAGPVGDDTWRLNAMFARGGDVLVPAGDSLGYVWGVGGMVVIGLAVFLPSRWFRDAAPTPA